MFADLEDCISIRDGRLFIDDLDTNELDRGFFALRFQGPDADAMVAVLVPLVYFRRKGWLR